MGESRVNFLLKLQDYEKSKTKKTDYTSGPEIQ